MKFLKIKNQEINTKSAFTLIELSIVILIASILISGLMTVSVNSINNANVKTTNERMKVIYDAIGNFVIANKRLPCPASITKIKSVDNDYGTEIRPNTNNSNICNNGSGVYRSSSNNDLHYGMLPIKQLGLGSEMAEDGFGNKFAYIMNQKFAGSFQATANDSDVHFGSADHTATILTINEKNGASTQTSTTSAIMAIVSYGSNKAGAFNANSGTKNTRSSDADEQENDLNASSDFDGTLVSLSTNSDAFDDIVFAKQRNELVEDFSLMYLIMCKNATGTGFGGTEDAYYGQIKYGSSCPVPANGSYSKKCEAYGTWVNINGC